MSILHHRRNVKARILDREANGRCSRPVEYPRASTRGDVAQPAVDAAPAAPPKAKRRRKAKAKRKARTPQVA